MVDNAVVAIACALFTVLGYIAGHGHRDLKDQLVGLHMAVTDLLMREKPKDDTEAAPKSLIVEPLTPEQQARKEFEERVKRLNP